MDKTRSEIILELVESLNSGKGNGYPEDRVNIACIQYNQLVAHAKVYNLYF